MLGLLYSILGFNFSGTPMSGAECQRLTFYYLKVPRLTGLTFGRHEYWKALQMLYSVLKSRRIFMRSAVNNVSMASSPACLASQHAR